MESFKTPILFLIFNRPDTTERVFAEIKKIKPQQLFIAADGPRGTKKGEFNVCLRTRQLVIKNIDWDCEVKTLFRDKNLGCKIGVSSAINWFFKNVEEGIILEDDCLPDQSFFPYCAKLLDRYCSNEQIFIISGNNFLPNKLQLSTSYYFSRLPHMWGWATWRRAWEKYDVNILDFPDFFKQRKIEKIWKHKKVRKYWLDIFKNIYNNKINTWDYSVTYALFKYNKLSISPTVNLISNIGFGGGTHTLNKRDKNANRPIKSINFPLIHPEIVESYEFGDNYDNKHNFLNETPVKIILKKLGLFNLAKRIYKYIL